MHSNKNIYEKDNRAEICKAFLYINLFNDFSKENFWKIKDFQITYVWIQIWINKIIPE